MAASPITAGFGLSGLVEQVASPDGRVIESIEINGNSSITSETITFYLSSRAGEPYSQPTALQDFMTLINTGFFEDLRMSWREGIAGGVIIVVEVVELANLRQIRIEGTTKVSPEDLAERLEKVDMSIEFDRPLDEQFLRRVREVLAGMLQGEEGLQFVQVDLDLEESTLGAGVDAVYSVIEGDEVRIAQVMFEGATVFSQRELRWRLKHLSEHWWMSWVFKGDRFSWAAFQSGLGELVNAYRSLGYLDFIADEPTIDVREVERSFWMEPRQRLFVTIPINEGPQYRVGAISVEGNTFFSDEELLELIPFKTGDVVNVDDVLAAQNAMKGSYSAEGFLQNNVFAVPEKDIEEQTADIVYQVEENDPYLVGRIEFEGNTHTRDHVLRRALRLNERERWSANRFNRSLQRLYQLGYFQDVEPELDSRPRDERAAGEVPVEVQYPEGDLVIDGFRLSEYGDVDVNLKVQEVGRNQVTFGGGVSALEGGFIQLGYTTRNLFGFGQTLSLYGQFGGRTTNAQIRFTEPYFLGKRVRFGLDLFKSALDYPNFQQERTGFSLRWGVPLDRNELTAAFIEYNYETIDIGDVGGAFLSLSDPLFQALFFTKGKRITASIRPFFVYNSVDNPFNPSRGKRLSGSYEYAGGKLGGTLDFWKATLVTTFYIPTVKSGTGILTQPNQIFAINIDARYSEPRGGLLELPIFERYFLGGSNSIRGTRLRSVGPVDERGNILGGSKSIQYNLEYIFQVADPLRLVLFTDGGQAWLAKDKPQLSDLRKTVGVEFRVFVPVFNVPFRFFWAYNFDPLVNFGEEKSTFEFAIGSTF